MNRTTLLALVLVTTLTGNQMAAQSAGGVTFGQIQLTGTATEDGQPVPMTELQPGGKGTGVYEAYMKAQPGEFRIQGKAEGNGKTVIMGQGNSEAVVKEGGKPFRITEGQVVRVRLDTRCDSISILPVTLSLKGNIVQDGTQVEYAGHGVWKSQVESVN